MTDEVALSAIPVVARKSEKQDMQGRAFVLIVVDRDTGEFTVEGPMTDDRPWNNAVVNAQRAGRNIRCFAMRIMAPDDAAAEWQMQYGGQRIAAGSIVTPK
jgi:hypothetical protein